MTWLIIGQDFVSLSSISSFIIVYQLINVCHLNIVRVRQKSNTYKENQAIPYHTERSFNNVYDMEPTTVETWLNNCFRIIEIMKFRDEIKYIFLELTFAFPDGRWGHDYCSWCGALVCNDIRYFYKHLTWPI